MTAPITPEALDELDQLERCWHGQPHLCELDTALRNSARSIIDELREARRMLPKLDAEGHAYARIADEMQAQRDAALREVQLLRELERHVRMARIGWIHHVCGPDILAALAALDRK